MPDNNGIKFVNPVSTADNINPSLDTAVQKSIFDRTVEGNLNDHLSEANHVTAEDKERWNKALDKSQDSIVGKENVFGKISYNEKGLITSVDTDGLASLYPQFNMSDFEGLDAAIEKLVPADADHSFIFDIVPNSDNNSFGEITNEGLKLSYKKIDTVGNESTLFLTIPKATDTTPGLMSKELYQSYLLVLSKIDAIKGKITILPSYDFRKTELTNDDFQTYLNYLRDSGFEVILKDGMTVYNINDNTEWVYNEETSSWVQDGDASVGIATNSKPGLIKTNSSTEYGISLNSEGKLVQNNMTNIGDALDALVDAPLIGTGDENKDRLYQRDDNKTISPASISEGNPITSKNLVIDNPTIEAGRLISLGYDPDTNLPIIEDSGLTTEGVDIAVLTPLYVNASNIATELRKEITTTDTYRHRYICYRGTKYGMINYLVQSNNTVVASGILSNKDRSYTFTYNSGYMTTPEIVPIQIVSSNLNNDPLSVMRSENGYDMNTCIAFFVLKNGVKIGLLNESDFNEYACNNKSETELMDIRGFKFSKNDITAFFFSTEYKATSIPANFLMNVKIIQNRLVIPSTVTNIGDNFLTNSGVVSLQFLNESFVIPATANFCNSCDDLQEIIAPSTAYANIRTSGDTIKFINGNNSSISWERGITLRKLNDTPPDESESTETVAKTVDLPIDEVLSIIATVPNNNNRKINADTNVILTVTDIGDVYVKGDDLSLICTTTDASSQITVNGISFAKNAVQKAVFGNSWDLTEIPNDFLRNFSGLNELGTIPSIVTSIGDRFLYGCTSFNQEMILHEGITSIGDSFLDDCTSFNSEISLPSSLKTIGTDFMSSCTSYTLPLTVPSTVTSINSAFMFSCYNFTGPLYVSDQFVNAINPVMALETDTTVSKVYEDGLNILGLTNSGFSSLIAKLPNSDTSDPTTDKYYRNIITDYFIMKLTLNDDSVVTVRSNEELQKLCSNTDGTTSISIIDDETTKTFTKSQVLKAEFGPGWNLSTTPVNFLMYFINMTEINDIPKNITAIDMNFLNQCSSLNSEIVIPNSVTSIENGFMTGCSAFNSKIVLSNTLQSIGDSFLGMCSVFNQPITVPSTVTSIGNAFMWDCSAFNNNVFVSNNFISAITPLNAFLSSNNQSPLFTDGVTIVGLKQSEMDQLLTKVPNLNDVSNYRNIKSVYNNGEFEIILISNDNEVIKISRDNSAHMNLIANVYATPDSIIQGDIKRKDITKVLFGTWDDVDASLLTIPDKFLFNFINLKMLDDIPELVTSIGNLAFYGCSSLEEINIPEQVDFIGTSFAYNCHSLTKINAYDESFDIVQYREIDDIRTFADDISNSKRINVGTNYNINIAPALKEIYKESKDFPYRQYASAVIVLYSSLNNTSHNFMMSEINTICNCSVDETIVDHNGNSFNINTIDEVSFLAGWSMNYIPDNFLKNFTALTTLNSLPTMITSIGNGFLNGCTAFNQELIISDSITSIGNDFLMDCTSFNSSLTIPTFYTSIGNNMLKNCTAYNLQFNIPSSVTSIGNGFLSGTAYNQTLALPSGLRTIGADFLANCNNFNQSIDLSSTLVTVIPNNFLQNCIAFDQQFVIPDTITSIGTYFLGGCKTFAKSISVPTGVTSIGIGFLNECQQFHMLNITPSFLTAITADRSHMSTATSTVPMYASGIFVFGLTESEFTQLITTLPNYDNTPYRKLLTPEAGSKLTLTLNNGKSVYAITDEDVALISTEDPSTQSISLNGTTFTKDQVTAAKFGTGYTSTSIPANFLMNFVNLTSLTTSTANIPSSVKTIGANFMRDCHAFNAAMTVPNTITASNGSIGTGFMHNCVNFTELNVASNFVNAITNGDWLTLSVDETLVGDDPANSTAPIYNPGITISGLTSAEFTNLVSATKLPNMQGEDH